MQSSVKFVAAIVVLSLAEYSEAFSTPALNLLSSEQCNLKNKCGMMGQLNRAEFSIPTRRAGLVLRQAMDRNNVETNEICEESRTEPKILEEWLSDFANRFAKLETTIAKHETTISEQSETISELRATVSEQSETISELRATVSEQSETISELRATVSEQSETISELSGQVFMLCKLQAVIASIEIMSKFFGLSQDARDPPKHAKKANETGPELRNMLTTVLDINVSKLDYTIELIDALWLYRHKVAHPAISSSTTIDDLIHVLKKKEADLDEREKLALSILEACDPIGKAPRYMSKAEKKAALVTPSPPTPKTQLHYRFKDQVNKATARPRHSSRPRAGLPKWFPAPLPHQPAMASCVFLITCRCLRQSRMLLMSQPMACLSPRCRAAGLSVHSAISKGEGMRVACYVRPGGDPRIRV
jgi:uncharacterized coiled-coil protein SlyX